MRITVCTAGKYYIKASIYMSKAHSRFGLYSKVLHYANTFIVNFILTTFKKKEIQKHSIYKKEDLQYMFSKKGQAKLPEKKKGEIETQFEEILLALTKDLEHPNELLISEFTTALASNIQNTNLSTQDLIKKAKVGLHEIIKTIEHPNEELVDQFFSLVVMLKNKQKPVSKEGEKEKEVKEEKENPPVKESAVLETDEGQAMLGLMMDEIKELVIHQSSLKTAVSDIEKKIGSSVQALGEDNNKIKKEMEDIKKRLEKIENSTDKFIGLYEVITNMYNPFAEKEDPTKKESEKNFFDAEVEKQQQLNKKVKE